MSSKSISVTDSGIRVLDLEVRRKDVADFLRAVPEEEREQAFVQAVEVGVFCLERVRTTRDTEFVRRQLESLLARVEQAVGTIPEETRSALVAKIGTGEGQVLAPIHSLVNEVAKTTSDRLNELRNLLAQDIDPGRETSTLGKALKSLRDLLDPGRADSVQGSFEAAINKVTAEDGALAKAVRTVCADAVKPLADEVERLAKEIRGQEAAAEAFDQTTKKGVSYEEEVVVALQRWSQVAGAEIHYVGTDNRPGDLLVRVGPSSLAPTPVTIVLEVRDRQSPLGRKAISDTLTEAMAEREARAAVYLSRSEDGLGSEVGEWAEGECELGPFVACTHEHLITALRFLIVQERLAGLRTAAPEVDSASIRDQLQRVRTALDRVKTINRKVTEVRGGANDIQVEAEALRDEVRGALTKVEDAMRAVAVAGRGSNAA